LYCAFQYGPVIKLPLQILPSIHGQPYGIDQSTTVIADWSIWQFSRNILMSFFETLLLGHIGMLIPWLKKSWITKSETPNSSFNYPKLRLWLHVGLFNLLLGRFGFCNPRLLSHGITSILWLTESWIAPIQYFEVIDVQPISGV
jgi:hypothetical protein